jgi:site-specific recombinase XerD
MVHISRQENLIPLISQYLDYLLVERQASKLTLRNYRQWLMRFSAWIHQHQHTSTVKVTDITQTHIHTYRLWLAKFKTPRGEPLKPATQSYHVIAIRSFLRWLVKNDYPVLAPEKVDLPKTQGRRLEYLNREQLERLLSQPSISTPRGLRDKAILEMLFSTGLRVSELVSLDRNQIDLKNQEFGVKGKGGKVRVVYLSDRAVHWLQRYLVTRKDKWPPLFIRLAKAKKHPTEDSSDKKTPTDKSREFSKFDPQAGEKHRLTARSVQRIVRKFARKAKLPVHITPHGLRHTFATDLLRAGADLRSVQELLGHKNIATTQIYTHITNKQLKEVHQHFHGKGD